MVDEAKRQAIEACGNCGQPERAHQGKPEDSDALAVLFALGGACTKFVVSDAAVILQRYLAITNNRAACPGPGKVGKRLPLHAACGNRHQPGSCPLTSGPPPVSDTAKRGAARAREALGLPSASQNDAARAVLDRAPNQTDTRSTS